MRLQNLFAVTFFDFGGMETQGQPLSNTSWESISGLNPQVWYEIVKMNLDGV